MHKPTGLLALVVGPSGVGKDTLINLAKAQLSTSDDYLFPQRYITRPKDAGGEDHIEVSEIEFARMTQAEEFALSWHAHGLNYGISSGIHINLKAGKTVVVNVSRTVLAQANETFPHVKIISVNASRKTLYSRLRDRNRETETEIQDRLNRAEAYQVSGDNVIRLSNDGSLINSLETFISVLT